MDFSLGAGEEQFRASVREFLDGKLPEGWSLRDFTGQVTPDERAEVTRTVRRTLAERRWLALPFAPEEGGLGAGHLTQAVFNEVAAYTRMPGHGGPAVSTVGPSIRQFGTPSQQRQWLPRIASGEDQWCVLYTEPAAGSDLNEIQTQAVRQGDEYVINGVKTLIAGVAHASMGWLLARTGPAATTGVAERGGLSMIAVPMDTPGIEVRPLPDLAGDDDLSEVSFDDVHVSVQNLVGEEHEARQQVEPAPEIERSGIEAYGAGKRHLEWLLEAARDEPRLVEQSPGARLEIADRWIELQVGLNVAYRVPLLQQQGVVPDYEASVSRLYGAELTQRIAGTGMRLLGPTAQIAADSPYARMGGAFSRLYLQSTAATIAQGTSEVQRNVIAQRGLGLPQG